ncbi:hypothetical protein [Aliiroseovarius sp. 2305UL8-7]|uniref:hypothetical protein n=1 Tax=Aliiroseovarius conchicola TaxID=3121637 RepID=UPI00352870F1
MSDQKISFEQLIGMTRLSPRVYKADWGYRLTAENAAPGLMRLTHAAGRFVGLVLLLMIAGVWMFSGNAFADPLIMAMKLGLTGLLFVLGWLLFWYGRDSQQAEAQVDLDKREMRMGYKDGWNRFRQETRIPFGEIGSFLILRGKEENGEAGLYARIGSGMDAFEVIAGDEEVLETIQTQLVKDLSSARRTTKPNKAWPSLSEGKAISLSHVTAP